MFAAKKVPTVVFFLLKITKQSEDSRARARDRRVEAQKKQKNRFLSEKMWEKCSKNPVDNGIFTKSTKRFLRSKTGFPRFSKNVFFRNP